MRTTDIAYALMERSSPAISRTTRCADQADREFLSSTRAAVWRITPRSVRACWRSSATWRSRSTCSAKHRANMQHAMKLLQSLAANPPLLRKRALAGLEQLKSQPNVDQNGLRRSAIASAASWFSRLARLEAGLAAVVAFHPALTNLPERDDTKNRLQGDGLRG